MRARTTATAIALAAAAFPFHAAASLGPYVHGNGIKSLGFGGITYAAGEETTALTGNPAHLPRLGKRYDIGVDAFRPEVRGQITGNSLGPDEAIQSSTDGMFIPQGGAALPLSEKWSLGFSVSSAGLGPQYPGRGPYERFGGGDEARIALTQSGVFTALGYRLNEQHSFGAGINLVYQSLEFRGVSPFSAASQEPGKVSDQGVDGRAGVGFGLGWHGELTPWLSAGVAYRSKTWTERHKDYAGLVPDGGKLELPAHYGAGIALIPHPGWVVAVDIQHFDYAREVALGNGIGKLDEGKPLGSEDGPGFGVKDQTAYKLGVSWEASSQLVLRAGFIYATQMARPSETLFNFLAPVSSQEHYTFGGTYAFSNGWEVSSYASWAPAVTIRGENSIPAVFGGGEADLSVEFYTFGLSLGRSFGGAGGR